MICLRYVQRGWGTGSTMSKRSSTGGYDPSGIDLDSEILENQLENQSRTMVNNLMTFGQDSIWRKNVRNHAEDGIVV